MLQEQSSFTPVLEEAANGAEALNLISNDDFDLVLLDLQMPKVDGFTVLTTLREKENGIPIIIFSFHGEEILVQRMLNAGANGYMSKGVSIEELLEGVDCVLNEGKYFNGVIHENNGFQVGRDEDLTKREWQILKLIAEESSNTEIAETLCISVRTVEGHKKNLTDKLNVKGSVGLTKYALKYGIVKNG
jgi:DNA-binding NarL/FixJ family response regulator